MATSKNKEWLNSGSRPYKSMLIKSKANLESSVTLWWKSSPCLTVCHAVYPRSFKSLKAVKSLQSARTSYLVPTILAQNLQTLLEAREHTSLVSLGPWPPASIIALSDTCSTRQSLPQKLSLLTPSWFQWTTCSVKAKNSFNGQLSTINLSWQEPSASRYSKAPLGTLSTT